MSVSVVGDGDLYYFKDGQWQSVGEVVGDDISAASVLDMCRNWPYPQHLDFPARGGTVTLNSVALGRYDWVYKVGNQTVSSSEMSPWFTSTVDVASSWVLVDGNLTVDSGVLFTPPTRKLFTVVYVTGDLAVSGEISMTNRGANHSGSGESGGATTAGAIRIATGTFSTVVDPQVPAAGGAGAAGVLAGSNANVNGTSGSAGSAGGTGGGGSGGVFGTNVTSGAGSAGTSFVGGGGGGGSIALGGQTLFGGDAIAGGGKGGDPTFIGNIHAGGGAGNPGGVNTSSGLVGLSGLPGTLVVIVEGSLSGSGFMTSSVGINQSTVFRTGGGAGGGSITVMSGSDVSTITPAASGSPAATSATWAAGAAFGGAGGAGTARKLAL